MRSSGVARLVFSSLRSNPLRLVLRLYLQECQATDNLWVCLICGNVFCGSRHEDHIRGHYTSTLHAYAIEIGACPRCSVLHRFFVVFVVDLVYVFVVFRGGALIIILFRIWASI